MTLYYPPPVYACRSELGAWFGTTGKWETSIRPTFIPAVAHMKEHRGAEVVGVTGFCWGGMIAMKAASMDPDGEGGVKAGGNVHPAMLSAELAQDVRHRGGGGVLLWGFFVPSG